MSTRDILGYVEELFGVSIFPVTQSSNGTPESDVDFGTGYFPDGLCALPFVV